MKSERICVRVEKGHILWLEKIKNRGDFRSLSEVIVSLITLAMSMESNHKNCDDDYVEIADEVSDMFDELSQSDLPIKYVMHPNRYDYV